MTLRRINTAQAIGSFIVSRESRGCSPNTLTWYEHMLRPLALAHKTLPAEAWQLDEMLAGIRRRLTRFNTPPSAATFEDHWKATRIFFRWTRKNHKWTDLHEDMAHPAKRRKLPKALTDTQVDRLLAANRHHPRDYAMLHTFLDTGIRLGELAGLTRQDVLNGATVGDCQLRIDGKTGERIVDVNPETVQLLTRLPYHDRYVWTHQGDSSQPVATSSLQKATIRAFARAGLRGGPHVLRHTFGTLYIRHGGNVVVLQQILGHTNIKTTMVYVELAAQQMREEHARFSPISRRLRLLDGGRAAAESAG